MERKDNPDKQRALVMDKMPNLKCRMNTLLALTAGCFLLSLPVMAREDEVTAFDNFQRLVQTSDPMKASKALERPVSDQKYDAFQTNTALAVVAVMDRASDFEKQFPNSTRLAQVRDAVVQTVSMAYGIMSIPIPTDRTDDVEAFAKKMLSTGAYDQDPGFVREGLQLILYRIAMNLPVEQQRARFNQLVQDHTVVNQGSAAWQASVALKNLDRLGHPLQLSFTAVDGRSISMEALKGKVVILDFWAPSCVPCVRDFPELREIYEKNKARGLEIIGLSKDPDPDALHRYLKKSPLPWPVKFDGHEAVHCVSDDFGIHEIPVVWLVDRNGNLCDLYGRKDLKKKIEALLETP
jgi:thiol-disulfide isomerase/thioredoxin